MLGYDDFSVASLNRSADLGCPLCGILVAVFERVCLTDEVLSTDYIWLPRFASNPWRCHVAQLTGLPPLRNKFEIFTLQGRISSRHRSPYLKNVVLTFVLSYLCHSLFL